MSFNPPIYAKVIEHGETVPVEVVSVCDGSRGKIASVRALIGQPFESYTHGGWTTSDSATVPAGLLKDVHTLEPEPQDEPDLLQLALSKAKPQWYSGEIVELVPGRYFLSEDGGFINLHERGRHAYVPVFWLDLYSGEWKVSRMVNQKYQEWMKGA